MVVLNFLTSRIDKLINFKNIMDQEAKLIESNDIDKLRQDKIVRYQDILKDTYKKFL